MRAISPSETGTLRVATWNGEWLGARSAKAPHALEAMRSWRTDVLVLTEFRADLANGLGGYVVSGGDDHLHRRRPGGGRVRSLERRARA